MTVEATNVSTRSDNYLSVSDDEIVADLLG